jgi:hypothetical protein
MLLCVVDLSTVSYFILGTMKLPPATDNYSEDQEQFFSLPPMVYRALGF